MNNRAKMMKISEEQKEKINLIREEFSKLYDLIDENFKPSREISLAYTKLEEAQFWIIKGISREGVKNE